MRWSISRSKSSWRTDGYSLLRCALLLPRPTDIHDETKHQATLWDAGLRIAKPQTGRRGNLAAVSLVRRARGIERRMTRPSGCQSREISPPRHATVERTRSSLRQRQANNKLSLQNRPSDFGPALGSLRLSQGATAERHCRGCPQATRVRIFRCCWAQLSHAACPCFTLRTPRPPF
jgi:hypothetical protein